MVAGLLGSRPVCGCRPYFEQAIFTYTVHPDVPLTSYAQGQWAFCSRRTQSYLYVAYRYLIGMSFDQEEKEALLALWNERLNPQAGWNPMPVLPSRPGLTCSADPAAGPAPPINVFKALEARNGVYYHEYVNCPADAFRTAANTLTERIRQFGADSGDLQSGTRPRSGVQQLLGCGSSQLPPHRKAPRFCRRIAPIKSLRRISMPVIWRSLSACFVTLPMIRRPTGDRWLHI